jgi:hypothetical protein
MPVVRDAYDTYMGRQLDQGMIASVRGMIEPYVNGIDLSVNKHNDDFTPWLAKDTTDVYGVNPEDWKLTDTPFFAHPIVVYDKTKTRENSLGGLDNFKVVADLRGVMRKDAKTGLLRIDNRSIFSMIAARAVLNHWWLAHGTVGPRRSMPVALPIFSDIVGDMIGNGIKMELDDNMRLRAWAAIWYYMAHDDRDITELKTSDKFDMYRFITTHLRSISAQVLEQVLECAISAYNDPGLKIERDTKDSIYHWFKLVPAACESVRLEAAMKDLGSFIQLLGRAYHDSMNAEMMAIAFEHPPTWLALLWSSMNDYNTYKNSDLTRTAGRPSYSDGMKQLIKIVKGKLA